MAPPRGRSGLLWLSLAALALLIGMLGVVPALAAHDSGAAGELIVADLRADELIVVDLDRSRVETRIPLPGGAHELLELPDGRIAVSIEQAGVIAIADLESGTVEELETGGVPHGLALDGDLLLVTDRAVNAVRRFELDGWRELAPIEVGRWPHVVAVTPAGDLAVANALDNTLLLGDRVLPVSEQPETVAVGPDGWVATAGAVGGEMHLFDPAGHEVQRVALGGRPVRTVFSPDGETIAVALSAAGAVALVSRDGAVKAVDVPGVPDGLAFDRDGARLYAGDELGGRISVIDVREAALVDQFPVGTATGALLVR